MKGTTPKTFQIAISLKTAIRQKTQYSAFERLKKACWIRTKQRGNKKLEIEKERNQTLIKNIIIAYIMLARERKEQQKVIKLVLELKKEDVY